MWSSLSVLTPLATQPRSGISAEEGSVNPSNTGMTVVHLGLAFGDSSSPTRLGPICTPRNARRQSGTPQNLDSVRPQRGGVSVSSRLRSPKRHAVEY